MTELTKYKKLNEVQHVLARSGMYIGSISNTETSGYLYDHKTESMVWQTYVYNPGLVKLFDEIISNSVDEHIRSGKVKTIRVTVSQLNGEITVSDDGGIPVKEHPEHKQYIPEMVFGELRAGSNFSDDNRITGGLNGLGSSLVNIFSTSFKVQTADGRKSFTQTFTKNMSERTTPTITASEENGTTITFIPDYERLNCEMDQYNFRRIEKRVYDVAGCNPKIKVYFNGELLKVNKFKDYVSLYVDQFVEESVPNWHIAVGTSENGFKHVSFVNGIDTFNGGTHVDYVANQITNKLREYIKRKHKIDIRPANIKQHLFLFVNCVINAPIFTSQTKEFMSSDVKDFGSTYEVSDKFIHQLIKSDVIQTILDWAEAQQRQKELAELRRMNKQTQNTNFLKKIVKFDDASSKNRSECMIALTEGDSASKVILSSRDPQKIGVFPLRGKPLNVRDIAVARLTANEELANIMAIIGLKLGEKHSISDLRFGKLMIASDFDADGAHIAGLVINIFQHFWPDLIKEGFLVRLKTPVIVATLTNKKQIEFFSQSEYNDWVEQNPSTKHSFKWYKGLGSWTTNDFKRFLSDEKYLEPLVYEDNSDFDCVDLAFDKKRADDRKEWLIEGLEE